MAELEPHREPNGENDAARGPRLREIPVRLMIRNIITVLAICAGLSGVRLAFDGRYEMAVGMVLLAAFLDGIDGRVARLLKATSKFGAQMDSLADIVNFGVAPGLVVYVYALGQARSLGWIAALVYAIAMCMRLARFNVMDERKVKAAWQSEYFVGVPAPAGAMLVMLPVYFGFLGIPSSVPFAYISAGYTIVIALLLVSRLPVWSGKSSKRRIPRDFALPLMLLVVLYVALLMTYTWEVMVATVIAYLASLPFGARAWHRQYGTLTVGDAGEVGPPGAESEIDRNI